MSFLSDLVIAKVRELGHKGSSEFFGVSEQLARQWDAGTKPVSLAAVEKVFRPPERGFTEAAWDGKKVMLMLPWYKTTNPLTAFCLLALMDRAKMGAAMQFGDAFIAHARNKLLDTLVSTGTEYGLFVDDDMILPCGNAGWFNRYTGMVLPEAFAGLHTINRLLSHGKTLVSALYFQRKDGGNPVYYEGLVEEAEGRFARSAPVDLLKPVGWTGTGCLLVHRSVATDIREKMPWLAPKGAEESWHYFSGSSDTLVKRVGEIAGSLEAEIGSFSAGGSAEGVERFAKEAKKMLEGALEESSRQDRLQAGEDAIFGRRAKACGHQSFVDMAVICGHVGGKVYGLK